jgi:uncharacterized membrane protein YhaH (DUF805 family)
MTIGGKIIYFDEERGTGFVAGDDGNRYVFDRHDLGAAGPVTKGMRVAFRADGDHARDIMAVSGSPLPLRAASSVPHVQAATRAAPLPAPAASEGLFSYFRRATFANYRNFRGRARRKEYWSFVLFSTMLAALAALAGFFLGQALGFDEANEPTVTSLALGIVTLLLFLPSLAVAVRRQHDIGLSGWFLLIWLIPTIGALVVLVFSLIPSQRHDNKWGPIPEGIEP